MHTMTHPPLLRGWWLVQDATLDFEVDVNGTPWDYTIKAGSSGTEPIPGKQPRSRPPALVC